MKSLSRVQLIVTPWAVAHQAPLSMGFSRQEYWSGLPFPSPGDLPNPGIEPRSPALQADALFSECYRGSGRRHEDKRPRGRLRFCKPQFLLLQNGDQRLVSLLQLTVENCCILQFLKMVTTIFPTPQALPPVTLPLPIKSENLTPSFLNLGWAGLRLARDQQDESSS